MVRPSLPLRPSVRILRRWIIPLLLALVVCGCNVPALVPPGAASSAGSAANTSGDTRVVVFSPSGTPATTVSGYCWVRSLAVWRDDAWRCMAGNFIHDPCFSTSDTATSVICVPDPLDQKKNIQMDLTRPLPAGSPVSNRTHAWALELDDGAVCTYFTGATGPIDGQRLNYGCSNGWDVVGNPTPDGVWTAKEVLLKPRSLVVVQERVASIKMVWE